MKFNVCIVQLQCTVISMKESFHISLGKYVVGIYKI